MDVAKPILDGLRHLKDRGPIPDAQFALLTDHVFQAATGGEQEQKQEDLQGVELKEALAALLTVVIEAGKHNSSSDELRSILEDAELPEPRIGHLCKLLDARRPAIRGHLGRVSLDFATLVGVEWRLDYYLKSELIEQAQQPVFFVTLKFRQPDGTAKDHPLTCSYPELEDLLAKVKDALKQAEKLHSNQ